MEEEEGWTRRFLEEPGIIPPIIPLFLSFHCRPHKWAYTTETLSRPDSCNVHPTEVHGVRGRRKEGLRASPPLTPPPLPERKNI